MSFAVSDKKHLKRATQLAFVDRVDHVCHPDFFFIRAGCVCRQGWRQAFVDPPACKWRRMVRSLVTSAYW